MPIISITRYSRISKEHFQLRLEVLFVYPCQYKKLMECLANEKPLYDCFWKMITSSNSSSLTSVLNSIFIFI